MRDAPIDPTENQIAEIFARTVAKHPDELAIIDASTGERWTFAELDKYARTRTNAP